jgi:hypothetical protein
MSVSHIDRGFNGTRRRRAHPLPRCGAGKCVLLIGLLAAVAAGAIAPSASAEDYPPGGLTCELANLETDFTPSALFWREIKVFQEDPPPGGDFTASSQRVCAAAHAPDVPEFFPGPVTVDLTMTGTYRGTFCFTEFTMTGELRGSTAAGLEFEVPFTIKIPEMVHNPTAGTLTIEFNGQTIESPLTFDTGGPPSTCSEGGFSRLTVDGVVTLPALDEADTDDAPMAVPEPEDLQPEAGAQSSTSAPGRFKCKVGSYTDAYEWAFVANVPSGYVTGNCRDGWTFDRQVKYTNPNTGNVWEGGYFFGNYKGCGWMRDVWNVLTNLQPGTACQSPSRARSTFMSWVNCNSPCGDGTSIQTVADCGVYGNVRPWGTTAYTDTLRGKYAGSTVKWRYLSKDGAWVMVRDTTVPQGQGNWGFMHRSCFPANMPGAIDIRGTG